MLALKKAIDEIKFSIPPELLNVVFINNTNNWRNTPISLDEQIMAMVIRPRVMVDADLVGGTEAFVSLEGVAAHRVDAYLTVYNIGKDRTQGRSIMAVASVSYLSASLLSSVGNYQLFNQCTVTPLLQAGQAMFDAVKSIPPTSTAMVRIVGENSIMIQDTMPPIGHGFVRCTIANEEELGNIQFRNVPTFAKLAELACKAYIYNSYIIKLDMGFLSGGQEIGKFKEIIESYADANEMYRDYLKNTWMKVAFMNDKEKMRRFIKLQVGAYR